MAQPKKMYYEYDNGDATVTCDWKGLIAMLEAETTDYDEEGNRLNDPSWLITLVWLTDEEHENLSEAY